jgi:hypothetical protein
MPAQTSYSINQRVALAGLIYALGDSDIVSRSVETEAGIGFGVAVGRGTDKADQIVLGTSSFVGITVRSLDREGTSDAILYKETETAGVMRNGYVWVTCPAGCNPGDAVKYTTATGVLDAGAAGAGEIQLDGAKWETAAAAGELAVIRIETSAVTVGS